VVCDADDAVNQSMAVFLTDLNGFLFSYAEKNFAVLKIFFKVSKGRLSKN
jgi:hypothetical protein